MKGSEITLARYYAKKAVKAQWQAQGLKPQHIESSKLNQAANVYLDQHLAEFIALATERYRSFVESGYLQRPRNRRKPSQ